MILDVHPSLKKKGQRWFNKWCFLPHTKITSTWFLTWSIMYKHSSTKHRRNDSLGIFWKKVVHVGFPFYIGWPPVMSSLKKMFLGNLPTKHHPAMGSWGSLLPFHYFQWKRLYGRYFHQTRYDLDYKPTNPTYDFYTRCCNWGLSHLAVAHNQESIFHGYNRVADWIKPVATSL